MKNFVKRALFFTVISSMVMSCSNDESLALNEDAKNAAGTSSIPYKTEIDVREYERALRSVGEDVSAIVENPDFDRDPSRFEEDLKAALAPLVAPSRELVAAARITDEEIPGFSEIALTDTQYIEIGVAIYANQIAASGGDPSVLDCVARAFVGLELHEGFWKSFTTRRALIKAVGKIATRYLGFVGAGLIVYDFIDCMEWI